MKIMNQVLKTTKIQEKRKKRLYTYKTMCSVAPVNDKKYTYTNDFYTVTTQRELITNLLQYTKTTISTNGTN